MTISDQAAARGVPVPVGSTAAELRAAGWEVPPFVLDTAVLDEEVQGEPVVTSALEGPAPTRPTGYVWRGWRATRAQ